MRSCFNIVILLIIIFVGCTGKDNSLALSEEDLATKAGMQGIWIDADEGSVVFRIKGDTVYYPDSVSVPVKYVINKDTMVLYGTNISKYIIVHRDSDSFDFRNYNGDVVRLVRSSNAYDSLVFEKRHEISLNQRRTIKRDTIVSVSGIRYHCYVQVNPTTYKVLKTSYNNEGLSVENIYYDNTIHVSVFRNGVKIYSRDFMKKDFAGKVPEEFLKQSILSDMHLKHVDDDVCKYEAELAVPDSYISFIVGVTVSYKGNVTMEIRN